MSLALTAPAIAQHEPSHEERARARHEARPPGVDAQWLAGAPPSAETMQVMNETEMGPPVPWRRGKRMTHEERRQLRQDINEAGRELYRLPARKQRYPRYPD